MLYLASDFAINSGMIYYGFKIIYLTFILPTIMDKIFGTVLVQS